MLNVNNEIWKNILFIDGYQVSNKGRVKSKQKILKTWINNSGYECIKIRGKHYLVHRLVAKVFIPNPNNYKEVNHINENKLDNSLVNLEWVTSSMNKQHSIKSGRIVYNRPTLGKKHKSNVSKYYNVGWDKNRNKWIAAVRYNNKNYYQKRFDNEKDAALHVNWILDTLNLKDRPRNIVY